MKHKRKRFFFIPLFILVAIVFFGGIVMLLWNRVITNVLNVKPISFGQAIGLFVLCKILFGSFRPGPPGGFRRGDWRSKLMDLSPEERDKFKQEWRQRMSKNAPED